MEARASQGAARSARNAAASLEERFEKLLLVSQAMWTLLQERTGLTEDDLMQRVTDLDMQDGQRDGKVTKQVVKCRKCNSAVSHQFNRCLFCGEPYEGGSAFSTV